MRRPALAALLAVVAAPAGQAQRSTGAGLRVNHRRNLHVTSLVATAR